MKKIVRSLIILTLLTIAVYASTAEARGRKQVEIESENAKVIVDLAGGSIIDFHLKQNPLNPLTWGRPGKPDLRPRSMGHFICFDRWGPASEAETKNGMPWHGEATHLNWDIITPPVTQQAGVYAEIICRLPIAGLNLKRTLSLHEQNPVLTVTEEITNANKLGRIYNLVQHATVGPPFLDESTAIDTNAKKGLTQQGKMPFPEKPSIQWPKSKYEGRLIDFRHLTAEPGPNVISFIFDDKAEHGWVTASNAQKGLLIGYFWKTKDYPWLNLWRSVNRGRPAAYGLEFGTTGLHQPFGVLVEKGKIFDRRLYEYIDAGQSVTKSYKAFLAQIPTDYKGVADIRFKEGTLVLAEHNSDRSRDIVVKIK